MTNLSKLRLSHHGAYEATSVPLHVVEQLQAFEVFYPNIQSWFSEKVVPGLAAGSRKIFLDRHSSFMICKKDHHERKICTLWVHPRARRLGLSTSFLRDAFEWLDTDHPLISVPEERECQFNGLLRKYNFKETSVLEGYYRSGRKEIVYNGWLAEVRP